MTSDSDHIKPFGGSAQFMVVMRVTVIVLFTVLTLPVSPALALQFKNFTATVTLTPQPDGFWSLAGNRVKITNRIVVKAAAGVGKEALRRVDSRVSSVTELYLLDSGSYFAVTFSDIGDLEQVLARFSASPLVLSAQPDLLQLHDKSGHGLALSEPAGYTGRLGIDALWQQTRGKGVKVAVIDDGFDLNHEDLRGGLLSFGFDLESSTLDSSPRTPLDTHGTEVAGIIFARHNGIGIDGIAPEAGLIAIRHPDTWTSRTILSFYLAKIAGADIINCSWTSRFLLEPVAAAIRDLTTRGRGGKGVAVVFAAGNAGVDLSGQSSEAVLPGVISVGAAGGNGRRLPFSNYGNNVTVSTIGHDIRTTSRGAEKYTHFSGTSASAAIVSGTIALFLSQEPELGLAEIKQKIFSFFRPR